MNTKEITISRSNDMHGDFLAELRGAEGDLIGGIALLYCDTSRRLVSPDLNGTPVEDSANYSILLQQYHYNSSDANLSLTHERLGQSKVVSTSARKGLEEYFGSHQSMLASVAGRPAYRA